MNAHSLLALFATGTLAALALIGKTTGELGFDDRARQSVPPPVPLVLPEPGVRRGSPDFQLRDSPATLPRGLVSIP